MKTFAAIAAAVLAAWMDASDAHGNHAQKKSADPPKEQKAWGIAGEARDVKRTIRITMTDSMRFSPDRIDAREGETVRIALRNEGGMLHEMVIGTKTELDAHAALMLKFPDMTHDEPYMAHVPPGKTGEIIWRFNRSGDFDFACLIAGHYQAGMVGKIKVARAQPLPQAGE